MRLNSLSDLLKDQLQDLYSAEKQMLAELPLLMKSAHNGHLKITLNNRLVEARIQIARLEKIAKYLDFDPAGRTCAIMKDLVAEENRAIGEEAPDSIYDANLIAATHRAEHYEIAAYASAKETAEGLGHIGVASWLDTSLKENEEADRRLMAVCRELYDPPIDPRAVKSLFSKHPEKTGSGTSAAPAATVTAVAAAPAPVSEPARPAPAPARPHAESKKPAEQTESTKAIPAVEHEYWRSQFGSRKYVTASDTYENFAPAYQYGWEQENKHHDKSFAAFEADLEMGWYKARGSSNLSWIRARSAVRDAWERMAINREVFI